MSAANVIDRKRRDIRLAAPLRAIAFALALTLLIPQTAAAAAAEHSPVTVVAQITIDDDGRNLHYPSSIFFDRQEEELFLINGGSSRVVVYGPDFFPRISIGRGRGVEAPRGAFVTDQGEVYLCQSRSGANPTPRITVLNAAFFVEREIPLEDIPDAATFSPSRLAVSREGLIYLAGEASRGVLVLDSEGTFLRRLRPMDIIADREAIDAARKEEGEATAPVEPAAVTQSAEASEPAEEAPEKTRTLPDIPEEFRPRSSEPQGDRDAGPGLGPVRIRHVSLDSAGNIYLVSGETSKIYVYGPDESFLFSFGEKGGTPRKLSQPRGLAIDENRKLIYVADYMRHSILVYDMAGKYLFEFGGRGAGPGWFNFPSDIALNRQGQLIVADLFNQRVQILQIAYAGAFPLFQSPRQGALSTGETAPDDEGLSSKNSPGTPETQGADRLDGDGENPPAETAPNGTETQEYTEEVVVTERIGGQPVGYAEEPKPGEMAQPGRE